VTAAVVLCWPQGYALPMVSGLKALSSAQRGVMFNVIAHLFWGVMALYFSFMRHISPAEIAAHRGLWSLPIAAIAIWWLGQWSDVWAILRNPRMLALLFFTSTIIVFNWGFYIWSIENGRALEASLGYFINPLLNVLAGFLFLGERFNRPQLLAIGLAAFGVVVQTYATGAIPWLGLMLGGTFCIYGLLRKMVPVGPTQGFFVEILLLALPLIALEYWLLSNGQGKFGGTSFDTWMLAGCGALTSGALIFFSASLKLIRYSTAGMLQYLSPSIVFLTAVYILGEPMNILRLASFALIWIGLGIYTWAMLQTERQPMVVAGANAGSRANPAESL
jgi:chloramphenicol-sensitive protein RarD